MNGLTPAFEVTRVSSMQWNRTMQVKALEKFERARTKDDTKPVDIPSETLAKVRAKIKEELAKID